MMQRFSQCALLAAIAFIYSLIVFNNLTDYQSNWHFVQHVLSMDSTFPGNHGMWRAIANGKLQTLFYLGIITWESTTTVLCWWGVFRMLQARNATSEVFQNSKTVAIAGLTLGMLLWFTGFLSIGAEWFLMWQSHIWNGQDAAFRMFTCLGIVLLYLTRAEASSGQAERA